MIFEEFRISQRIILTDEILGITHTRLIEGLKGSVTGLNTTNKTVTILFDEGVGEYQMSMPQNHKRIKCLDDSEMDYSSDLWNEGYTL